MIKELCEGAKSAEKFLAAASNDMKNTALLYMAKGLIDDEDSILAANAVDLENGKKNGLSSGLLDRLMLNDDRICAMSEGMMEITHIEDPVGKTLERFDRPNGLKIKKVSVPMGVIGIIYEARPNVTADAAAICLKAGNAVVLRGGKEAINSNIAIANSMRNSLADAGFPEDCINLVTDTSRDSAAQMMRASGLLDLLIPRGGAGLIKSVVENSSVPVIETGTGNCHIYIDEFANLEKGANIVYNAKTQRVSVCNAAESLLVHEAVAKEFLPKVKALLDKKNVEIRGCEKCADILGDCVVPATEKDFAKEFLDYIISVKVVKNIDEAIAHIGKYSTGHSESIITENAENAERLTTAVDSAAVYVNASTRFTDGGEFGFGAEIGISTQKLHARGPMGVKELTSYKYVILGNGQIR